MNASRLLNGYVFYARILCKIMRFRYVSIHALTRVCHCVAVTSHGRHGGSGGDRPATNYKTQAVVTIDIKLDARRGATGGDATTFSPASLHHFCTAPVISWYPGESATSSYSSSHADDVIILDRNLFANDIQRAP
jgi:hypothetical protein